MQYDFMGEVGSRDALVIRVKGCAYARVDKRDFWWVVGRSSVVLKVYFSNAWSFHGFDYMKRSDGGMCTCESYA